MKRILQTTVILLIPVFLFGQEFGKIVGKVTDETTGEPLVGANVLVEGTSFGAAADAEGNYTILAVPVGTYAVRGDFIGYRAVRVANVHVSYRLTTEVNMPLSSEAIEAPAVEVIAERPLIVKDATNATRIIDRETINSVPLREVQGLVALQTGVVKAGGTIHVRGGRPGDMAYYHDGVYVVNPWTLSNPAPIVHSRALEEIAFQSGGFDAEFGNSNGGVINTTTRTGGEKFDVGVEFIQGLGASEPGEDQDALYSYGYQLYNFDLGGPLGDRIRFFVSYEGSHKDDARPSVSYLSHLDRQVVTDTTGMSADASVRLVESYGEYNPETDKFETDSTKFTKYSNYRRLYGPKPNGASDRTMLLGNIVLDLKPLRIKVGGGTTTMSSRGYVSGGLGISQGTYPSTSALLNSENNAQFDGNVFGVYTNFTLGLSPKAFARLNLSYFNSESERGDHRHMGDIRAYGDPTAEGNEQLIDWGKNPLAIEEFAYFGNFGSVYDEYRKSHMSYIGAKGDVVSQAGSHELKLGFEYRAHTLRDYRLSAPMEIAEGYRKAEVANWGLDGKPGTADDLQPGGAGYIDVTDDTWLYTLYRNAYTLNTGYTQQGKEIGEYNEESADIPPGKPVIMGVYFQDKIELEDMILNVGIRFDRFDFNTEAPESSYDLWLKEGRIDREASKYAEVESYSYLSPRIGFSFPVTDRTVLHAQYGTFVQHPILNRLYLSDSHQAANLTQGNMVVSPNAKLKPERTTQYEVGFAQQIGEFAALDLTGYYKEVRDYTFMANLVDAKIDGAVFSWAQYLNGDYGVVKGLSASLTVRRVRGIRANVSYTVQWANGTGTDPLTNWNIAWTGGDYPTAINPLDYDQRHTGSAMVDYRAGRLLGLFDFGVNALYQFGSGIAYTPSVNQSDVFGSGWYRPVAAINSAYRPWTSTLDLRIDFDRIVGTGLSAYVWVVNALNTVNVRSVYPGTGEAGSDGWLETSEGKVWLSGNPEGEAFYQDRLRSPGRWETPRMVRVGLTFRL